MKHLPFSPTPVTFLPYFSKLWDVNLWSKRDDLFYEAGGGSKARMLQYILVDVNPRTYDIIVTAGGPCSNFSRACALMCAKIGLPMHLIEYTDEPEEFETSLNYKLSTLAGIRKTRCSKNSVPETIESVINDYERRSKKVKFIYGGGKSLEGIFAYYDAVEELYRQGVHLDHLFVACGTGTTLTGICAGMQKYYPKARVHAISIARKKEEEEIVLKDDMRILNEYLLAKSDFANMQFHDEYLCGGYAKYNEELISVIKECISKEGMIIDPTYSGKAFYGMESIITKDEVFCNKDIIFWNTGGIFNLISEKI